MSKSLNIKSLLFFFSIIFPLIGNSQTWQWAKSLDGPGSSVGTFVATDSTGNVFITGCYTDTLFAGQYTLTTPQGNGVYLVKYDANGNVLWAKNSIGSNLDISTSVKTDKAGNVYIAGHFDSQTISFGTYTLTNTGTSACFLVKYDPNGNILWAKGSTVSGINATMGLAIDKHDNVYIAGEFNGFTIMFDSFTLTNTGIANTFLVKYDPNGNIIWAKSSNGAGNHIANSVDCDVNGNIIITGDFTGSSVSFGSITLNSPYSYSLFIAKYDSTGNVVWAKSAICASSANHTSKSISVDSYSNSYITGYFKNSINFSSHILSSANQNFFLVKYDVNGNVLWAKNSNGTDINPGVVCSYSCGVFLSGSMDPNGTSLTLDNTTFNAPYGAYRSFLANYDVNGNLISAQAFVNGGANVIGVCVDNYSNAYITGDYLDYPMLIGTTTLPITGGENIFTAKLSLPSTNCISVGESENQKNKSNVTLYPNPTNDILNIKLDVNTTGFTKIEIINSLGQLVCDEELTLKEKTAAINTSALSNGVYLINLKSGSSVTASKRFVVVN